MSRLAFGCIAFVLAAGCGGGRQSVRPGNRELQLTVGELRAEGRRARARIHDLENQLLLMQDKLETAQLARRGDTPVPRLPVEVLEPDDGGGDPGHLVVGVDDDGAEIVYEGEAARPTSVSPAMRYDDSPPGDYLPAHPERSDPERVAESRDDRIPVTGGAVPSIDAQMRVARSGQRLPPLTIPGHHGVVAESKDDADSLYRRHQAALTGGRHADAIAGFRDFVARFPGHDYVDNAQYWLGEAFYDQKQYRQAMGEFRKVVKDHPRGNKVPDALLKVGYCYAALGEAAKARDVLGQVVAIYPASGPARLAAQKLDELTGGKERP